MISILSKPLKAGFKAFLLGDRTAKLVGPVHARLGFEDYFKPGSTASSDLA
jgi:hypothetical protein